jgi:hypothetical protein
MKVTRRDSDEPKGASVAGRALHNRLKVLCALCAELTQGLGILKETEEGRSYMKWSGRSGRQQGRVTEEARSGH